MNLQKEKIMKSILIYIIFSFLIILPINLVAEDTHDNHDHAEETKKAKQDEHDDHDSHEGHDDEQKFVKMTSSELKEFGVELSTAGSGEIQIEIVVTGEIVVNGERVAHIVPRFTGIIKEIRKKIGDTVKKGDVLAIVESNESLKAYEVKSLMNGTIIDKDASLGEVHSMNKTAFLIADLDTVWANLNIYQMYMPLVKIGQQVNIILGHGKKSQLGTISYISPIVDEHTRTATARVVLDNSLSEWSPGLLIEGIIITSTTNVSVVIPKTALHNIDGSKIVFVQTGDQFIPQPVVIGRTNHSSIEITSGLIEGQIYVSKGGLTLKSELQKGSFGEGHSH